MSRRSRICRIIGTPILAPYVPWESTPGRAAFAGFSAIHTSSASKSKVMAAAERAPAGQRSGPEIFDSSMESSSVSTEGQNGPYQGLDAWHIRYHTYHLRYL